MKPLTLFLVPVLAVLCTGCNQGTPERPEKPRITAIIPGDPGVNAPTVAILERPEKRRIREIMPGDSVRVRLFSGVNAPTDGTPYPVVFKLVGNVIGLDGKSVGLGEARMIAAAQGSLTDSRVLFRLTRLSMRLPNGRRKEFGIDGWVVGEDGIRGMGGRLLDPKNDPSVWKVHGVCGITEGMESIIKERLAHLVPVVQVLGNREATVVFSQSLALPDIPEQLEREESSVVYTALD